VSDPNTNGKLVARIAHAPVTPADQRLEALIEARFNESMTRHPVMASFLGAPGHDDDLSDGSREAVLHDAALAHEFLDDLERINPADLSPYYAIERELGQFTSRREIFDIEEHRVWERRVNAADEIGDGIFLLITRGTRPLGDRLMSIASRIEKTPTLIEQHKTRLNGDVPPAKLWNEMELEAVESMGSLFDEVIAAAEAEFGKGSPEVKRIDKAAQAALRAFAEYTTWLQVQIGRATEDYALGPEKYDELVGLRAFDGLTSDDILEIG